MNDAPLAATYYTDPAVFAHDRDNIFYRTWQCVCHLSEVADAGDFVTHSIVDEDIFVVRDDVIYTPEATSALNGITRKTIFRLAADRGSNKLHVVFLQDITSRVSRLCRSSIDGVEDHTWLGFIQNVQRIAVRVTTA